MQYLTFSNTSKYFFELVNVDVLYWPGAVAQRLEHSLFIADNPSGDTDSSTEKSDDDSDFFSFKNTPAAEFSHKHLEYLNDNNKELSMLENHPIIKKLFIRYNSCIPSSAPVETL